MPAKKIDLTGQPFGRLRVIAEAGRTPQGRVMWLCRCECGTEKEVVGHSLRTGATKSCGCGQGNYRPAARGPRIRRRRPRPRQRVYNIWLKYSAKRRCVFRADDDRTYAVEYEGRLDTGDFEVGGDGPPDYGWYGDTVEAVEVEECEVTVTKWLPVD